MRTLISRLAACLLVAACASSPAVDDGAEIFASEEGGQDLPSIAIADPAPEEPELTPGRPAIMIPAAAQDERWAVQVGSFRSEPSALAAWTRLAARHAGLMSDRQPFIARAAVSLDADTDKQDFLRLYAGKEMSLDSAMALCRALEAAGSDCLVRAQHKGQQPLEPLFASR